MGSVAGLILAAMCLLLHAGAQAAMRSGPGGGARATPAPRVQAAPPPQAALMTSRAARRESMRQAGIPTSQQPSRQLNTPAGRQLHYEAPRPGGGSRKMVVTNQTTDRVPGHGKHWEAGAAKIPERKDPLGRSRVSNEKSKVEYGKP